MNSPHSSGLCFLALPSTPHFSCMSSVDEISPFYCKKMKKKKWGKIPTYQLDALLKDLFFSRIFIFLMRNSEDCYCFNKLRPLYVRKFYINNNFFFSLFLLLGNGYNFTKCSHNWHHDFLGTRLEWIFLKYWKNTMAKMINHMLMRGVGDDK